MKPDLTAFQKVLNYKFKQQDLLVQALTHKSFTIEKNKDKPNNERLEFLGDSILNFVIAEKLVDLFPQGQEGLLSKKRATLVNLNKLAEKAESFKLEEYMYFGPGEVKQGNHLNARLQGSCVEALIGAIYLDSNYETTKKWVLDQYTEADYDINAHVTLSTDFKSRLQELTQKHKLGAPQYELVLTTGPSHKPQFLVALKLNQVEKARAEAATKKNAEQRAAEILLTELIKVYHES